ncbi:MAG: transporter, partial [Duncaniella sp.]|nr:transporter [Duncaniella sp.]
MLIIALNVAIVLTIFYVDGNTGIEALVGVMSGAVTNTPGLAAAQQTAGSTEAINIMAMGYAAAYPLGVIGIILSMLIVKAIFKIRTEDEIKAIEDEIESSQQKPLILSFEVTNKLIDGKTLY